MDFVSTLDSNPNDLTDNSNPNSPLRRRASKKKRTSIETNMLTNIFEGTKEDFESIHCRINKFLDEMNVNLVYPGEHYKNSPILKSLPKNLSRKSMPSLFKQRKDHKKLSKVIASKNIQ